MERYEEHGTAKVAIEQAKQDDVDQSKEPRVLEDVESGPEAASDARIEKIYKYATIALYLQPTALTLIQESSTAESSHHSGSSTFSAPVSAVMSAWPKQ